MILKQSDRWLKAQRDGYIYARDCKHCGHFRPVNKYGICEFCDKFMPEFLEPIKDEE